MRRYATLWRYLFALSWKSAPGLTFGALAVILGDVIAGAAYAIGLKTVVDMTDARQLDLVLWIAGGTAMAFALAMVLQDIRFNLLGTVTDRVGRLALNPQIHANIAKLDSMDHLEQPEYLDRVTVVRGAAGKLMKSAWNPISVAAGILKLFVTILLLGSVSPWLLILVVLSFIPIWTNQRGQRLASKTEVATAEAYRLQQQLFDLLVQTDSGKEIRVSGNGKTLAQKQVEAWNSVINLRFRARLAASVWKIAGWLVFTISFAIGLAFVAYQVTLGNGTVGDLVLTVTIASVLQTSMQAVVNSITSTAGSIHVLEPYLWLQEYIAHNRSSNAESKGTIPERLVSGITIENLSFTYPGLDRNALDNISVNLPAGSVTAIVGEYGSGKTTLVKMLFKFHTPNKGRILVDGTDINTINTSDWRERTTAAFQDFGRYHIAFGDTIGIGDLAQRKNTDALQEAIVAANATDLVSQLPDGMATQLGLELGGIDLSDGQWQRTALGRVNMRTNPLLLVLDEPTATLDAPSEHDVFVRYMTRARALAKMTGAVTVIVSHRFSSVTGADQIIVLDQGRVVEMGSHQELIEYNGNYAELYEIQMKTYREGISL